MANLTTEQATVFLRALGWRIRTSGEFTQAVTNFQRGWNLGPPIDVIGIVGPKTSAGLRLSIARKRAGLSTASEHFSFTEFACHCGGEHPDCPRIWILRAQIQRMELYRGRVGGAVKIVSGCRCRGHNKAVGGASKSQHLFGAACDVRKVLKDTDVRAMKRFAGIGRSGSTHLVAHVDSRDRSGQNTTGGTPTAPTMWDYLS